MSCTKFRNDRFRLVVAGKFPVIRAPDRRGRSVTGKADMTFASIIDAMPLWAMALSAMLLLWLALRFRGLVAIAVTVLCFIGLKSAGDAHLWIAIPVGVLVYGVLGAIAGLLPGGGSMNDDGRGFGAHHAEEQARLARDYHRRDREARF